LRAPVTLPQKRPGQFWVNFGYRHPEAFPLLATEDFMVSNTTRLCVIGSFLIISLFFFFQHQFDMNMSYHQTKSLTNVPVSMFCNWAGKDNKELLAQPKKKSNGTTVSRNTI
jgi:hypothetical protein